MGGEDEAMDGQEAVRGGRDRALGKAREELLRAQEEVMRLSRRRFLGLGAAAAAGLLLNPLALGAERKPDARGGRAVETGVFVFPRLQFTVKDNSPDRWNVGPIGDVILKQKLGELTNINLSQEPKIVRLADFDDMVRHPFVFMTSEGAFDLPPNEQRNMREYLERGGFVQADDCVFNGRDVFFQDYIKLINGLFPDNPMREVPLDHEIFHCYYDFPAGAPHMQGKRFGQSNAIGLFERGTGRLMTFACPGDLHCGWMCKFWGMEKNMEAIKMGINIILYFLSH